MPLTGLVDYKYASRIAAAALPQTSVLYGPWEGSMRSVSADRVPKEYLAESDSDTPSSNFLYLPRSGYWRRRLGQVQRFDTFGAAVGHLPAKWSSKCRQVQEFNSDSISDGIPTLIALLTRETISTGLDDGRFSNVWVRDQVANLNYTIGDEYGTVTYPVPGTEAAYKFVPLWYDSGDGGLTRGVTEFARRFFFGGSRRFQKVGNWWYFPSLFGTPSRWQGLFTPATQVLAYARPSTDVAPDPGIDWSKVGGAGTFASLLDDTGSDVAGVDYARFTVGVGVTTLDMNLGTVTDPGTDSGWILKLTMRSSIVLTNARMIVELSNSGGATWMSRSFGGSAHTGSPAATEGNITTGFVQYSVAITAAEAAVASFGANWVLAFSFSGGSTGSDTWDIAQAEVNVGSSASLNAKRLMPSGPLPPCHAGSLAKGPPVAGGTTTPLRPDADSIDGGWTDQAGGTSLFAAIDEPTADDTDFIKCTTGAATGEIRLSDPGFVPTNSTHTVTINFRSRVVAVGVAPTLAVELFEGSGGTQRATISLVPTNQFMLTSVALSPAQIASITDWTNLFYRMNVAGGISPSRSDISYMDLTITPIQSEIGGWKGSDRFYYSVAYRFEDDSIWMPCIPRAPNATLPNGFNLFTVDSGNPTISYESVLYSNLPQPLHGVKRLVLLRSTKIDSTSTDNLELNPFDLRVVAEVEVGTTGYTDYAADDDALFLDVDELLIRHDHIMPPRARHLFAGDARVCHGYGGQNPAAIILAPVGRAADYDLNFSDTTDALWNQNSMYFRIAIDSAGAGTLTLNESDGTTIVTTITVTFATDDTLQKVVDRINATSVAVNGSQWRAQLAPGANPEALCNSSLTPHSRVLANCSTSTTTALKRASGGLSVVAVGALVTGTNIPAGTRINTIVSDYELTMSAAATATGTVSATFTFDSGDAPTAGTATSGYQRVIANSLPGFIYFNNAYLDKVGVEKSTIWMTVASPGAVKSAPNCFSGKLSNRHTPPLEAGISMGGVAVDNGFIVPFSNKRAVIRNTRDQGTGLDQDYRLFITNESSGCCAWNSLVGASRFAMMFSPEGWIAQDLNQELLLSEAIYSHAPSVTGDFGYEAPLCVAASAADTDAAYMSARIMRGALWVSYRASGSHPNRQVVYDFSSGHESAGLLALLKGPGQPWGWSVPLVRSVTAMTEGRRTGGALLYGWNEENAGSTGDGRIDELETSETDNGVAIAASLTTPWLQLGAKQLSAHEITAEHSSPSGATVALDFHRSFADETYSLTPSLSSTLVVSRDVKMLPLAARVSTAACFMGWRQSAGTASELRELMLRLKVLTSSYK